MYIETYNYLVLNGVSFKEDAQLTYMIRKIEKLRKQLAKF